MTEEMEDGWMSLTHGETMLAVAARLAADDIQHEINQLISNLSGQWERAESVLEQLGIEPNSDDAKVFMEMYERSLREHYPVPLRTPVWRFGS